MFPEGLGFSTLLSLPWCSHRMLFSIVDCDYRASSTAGVATFNLSFLPDARHWRTGTQLFPPNGSGRAFAKPGVGSRRHPIERRNARIDRLRALPHAGVAKSPLLNLAAPARR